MGGSSSGQSGTRTRQITAHAIRQRHHLTKVVERVWVIYLEKCPLISPILVSSYYRFIKPRLFGKCSDEADRLSKCNLTVFLLFICLQIFVKKIKNFAVYSCTSFYAYGAIHILRYFGDFCDSNLCKA